MKKLLVVICALFVLPLAAHAFVIDTGYQAPALGEYRPWALCSFQYLAGRFTLSQDSVISALEGYMFDVAPAARATIALYGDDSAFGRPDVANELYAGKFDVVANVTGWYGVSGLAKSLAAGTYWVAFEVRKGDTFAGAMPNVALHPLDAYAALNDDGTYHTSYLDLGVKITGTDHGAASPVPEPSTLLLLGAGLAGALPLLGRFKK